MANRNSIKKHLATVYQYSLTKLTLNYYTYFESISESEFLPSPLSDYNETLNQLIQGFLEGRMERDEIHTFRNQVITAMETITGYADFFQNYEYVLNRLERRFLKEKQSIPNVSQITDELMNFLSASEDSTVFNTRIQLILEQLPVRYTKQKFFGMVQEGLSPYVGTERYNLDGMMYFLKMETLIENLDSMETGYEDLYKILKQFLQIDFSSLTEDEYYSLIKKLMECSKMLIEISSNYKILQEIINDLYVLNLTKEEAAPDTSEEQICITILKEVLNHFINGNTSIEENEMEEELTQLEGRQESLFETYLDFQLPKDSNEDIKKLARIDRLLSSSSFMKLDEEEKDSTPADRMYLEQAVNRYAIEAEAFFKTCQRPVIRAIMAKILSNLPVFFNSVEEIRGYIENSLSSCTDVFERESSIELLVELMESENALV